MSHVCRWRCNADGCAVEGWDVAANVGTVHWSYRGHWLAWHAPRSIYTGTGL